MSCHLKQNFLHKIYITNSDSIAGVDYVKVKNDVIYCKTIIFDRSQIHAASNFSLLSSRIASYVTINCYTLLHQATRGEGKNSFRCRNIFVSARDPQRCFCITVIDDVLSSFKIYNIQFKKVKIFWWMGAEGQGLDMRAGGRITQRPEVKVIFDGLSLKQINKIFWKVRVKL